MIHNIRLYFFSWVVLLWQSAWVTISYLHPQPPNPHLTLDAVARASNIDHRSSTIHHLPSSARFGIITGIEQDSLLFAEGYRFIEENTQQKFSPLNLNREQFLAKLEQIQQARCKVYAVNVFMPGQLKLVGPAVDEAVVLRYVDSVFRRCREAGVFVVVLGSGEARKIPAGFDRLEAERQFVGLLRKMGPLAGAQGVVVAMENLNREETNLGNTLAAVTDLVRRANHPNIRVTADIYHMLKEDDPPESIRKAGDLLVHCHIAEEKDRARPGKNGEDFRPYFKALRDVGFSGKIMMECRWTDLSREAGPALEYLEKQWMGDGG